MPNKLLQEKLSYLLQYVYNQVDWYAKGDVVFEKERVEAKQ